MSLNDLKGVFRTGASCKRRSCHKGICGR